MGWNVFQRENPFRGITEKEATQEAEAILDASRAERKTEHNQEKRSSRNLSQEDADFVNHQIELLLQVYKKGEKLDLAVQAVRTYLADRGLKLGERLRLGQIIQNPTNAVIHNPLSVDWRTCRYRVLLPPIVDREGIIAGPWLVAVQDHFSSVDDQVFT